MRLIERLFGVYDPALLLAANSGRAEEHGVSKRRWKGVKTLPDSVYAILCCCLQSAFHDGGRGSHRNSIADAQCLAILSGHCGVLSVSGWMFKHSPSRVCETAPTAAGATFDQRPNARHHTMLVV